SRRRHTRFSRDWSSNVCSSDLKVVEGKLVKGKKCLIEDYINFDQHLGKSKKDLIREGGEIFNVAVQNLYDNSNKKVVIPITSGLDSRLILGGLLNVTNAENIIAYTCGTPGTMDYEISKAISSKLGIEHYLFDVTKYRLTYSRLKDYAINSGFSVPLFDHWPMEWIQELLEA